MSVRHIAVVFALLGCLWFPSATQADDNYNESIPYAVEHDSGGSHTHSIIAYAELTSPIKSHTYYSDYTGGYIPVYQAGYGKFITSRGCTPSWNAIGEITGADGGSSASDD